MNISKKIQDALNKQVNEELESAYIYLGMAASLEGMNFSGMASWMKSQANEEIRHAMKLFDFVNDRQGDVKLMALPAPKQVWKNPLEVFHAALGHEQLITKKINELVRLADRENDHATHSMLHWFVDEQVEEEANASENVKKIKMIGSSNSGLLYLDKEMGKRSKTE